MPKVFERYLEGNNIFCCRYCGTHLAALSELVSEHYRSQHGTAFLFNQVVNVIDGPPQTKEMTSGTHVVCDIFCVVCGEGEAVGWKYVKAHKHSQKFKEGRFILSEALLTRQRWNDY